MSRCHVVSYLQHVFSLDSCHAYVVMFQCAALDHHVHPGIWLSLLLCHLCRGGSDAVPLPAGEQCEWERERERERERKRDYGWTPVLDFCLVTFILIFIIGAVFIDFDWTVLVLQDQSCAGEADKHNKGAFYRINQKEVGIVFMYSFVLSCFTYFSPIETRWRGK